jgi:outer membrane protein assembly factor BamB
MPWSGAIYVPCADGHLVKVDPGGQVNWRVRLTGVGRVSTPAVQVDGTAFVVNTFNLPNGRARSSLFSISPEGHINWARLSVVR